MSPLPKGFVELKDPRMIFSLAYATEKNFMGRPVQGYLAPRCVLTEQAASALIAVQDALEKMNPRYRLKIFDTYRPTTAVADFVEWSKDPLDQKMKTLYYPEIDKPELFVQGYISKRSSHSRGSTVDLTITEIPENHVMGKNLVTQEVDKELDMGTPFDFFDDLSHTANPNISETAKQNRQLLKGLMEKVGFENYRLEWWHYTLTNEPFPDTYFDFLIE